jgi:uncharacterized protein YbjQ (UPF0145 family)
MKRAFFLLPLLALLVSACATGPRLAPKAGPEEVELIDPQLGQTAEAGYRTIGPVRVEQPLGTARADMLIALRAAAARLGADAVILQRVRSTTEGEVGLSGRQEMLIAEGLAIYWPDRQTAAQPSAP